MMTTPKLRGALSNKLSAREQQVLDLFLVDGAMNKDLAHSLGVSEQTVKDHMDAIREKLGYANRAELAVMELRKRVKIDSTEGR